MNYSIFQKYGRHLGRTALILMLLAPLPVVGLVPLFDGTVTVHGRASVAHDTNIFTNANEHSDWVMTFIPSLRYVRAQGLLDFEAEGGVRFLRFNDFSEQNAEDWFIEGGLSYPNRPGETRAHTELNVGWRELSDARESLGERVTSQRWHTDGLLRVNYSERAAVRASAAYAEERFEERRFSRRDGGYLQGDAIWAYSENLDVVLGYRFHDTNSYDRANISVLHTQDHRIMAGLEGDIFPKVKGTAAAGVQYRQFQTPDLETQSRPSIAADLQWDASDKTVVSLEGIQDFYSTVGGRSAGRRSVSLTLQQTIHRRAEVRSTLRYRDLNFSRDDDRRDQRYGASIGLYASFAHDITGRITYAYLQSNSNRDQFDYERHVYEIGVHAGF